MTGMLHQWKGVLVIITEDVSVKRTGGLGIYDMIIPMKSWYLMEECLGSKDDLNVKIRKVDSVVRPIKPFRLI
jgi:hypothetical protein